MDPALARMKWSGRGGGQALLHNKAGGPLHEHRIRCVVKLEIYSNIQARRMLSATNLTEMGIKAFLRGHAESPLEKHQPVDSCFGEGGSGGRKGGGSAWRGYMARPIVQETGSMICLSGVVSPVTRGPGCISVGSWAGLGRSFPQPDWEADKMHEGTLYRDNNTAEGHSHKLLLNISSLVNILWTVVIINDTLYVRPIVIY